MEMKEPLTNDKLRAKFKSQFELVNYAIRLAENMIHTGRTPRIKTDSQNPTVQVVEEITAGQDWLDDIESEEGGVEPSMEIAGQGIPQPPYQEMKVRKTTSIEVMAKMSTPPKKARKLLVE